jgi:hypothetical protein
MAEADVAGMDPAARPGRRVLALGVVVLAVLILGGWWVTHPTRLAPVGSATSVQATVGQSVVVGLFAYPQDGDVVLRGAVPRVAEGSAAAKVRVLWCVGPPGGSPIGALRATAEASCTQTPRLGGKRLTRPRAQTGFGHLVVEVVPLEPGQVTIEGADVAYSTGLRRGTQSSGVVVKLDAAA